MFNKVKQDTMVFFMALLLGYMCSVAQAEEVKDASIELKAERIQLSNEVNVLEGVQLEEGQIVIEGQGTQGTEPVITGSGAQGSSLPAVGRGSSEMKLEQGIQATGTKTQNAEPRQQTTDNSQQSMKQKQRVTDNGSRITNYKGVSISDTGGKAMFKEKPKNMKRVENLGKPKGSISMAQPIESSLKEGESPELKAIEEKRLKRKEAFKKELERRDARKALINRQIEKEE